MQRNFFDLSHEHKLSTDMGYLVPVMTEEVLPGDTFIASTSLLARVAPLVNPVMHNVEIRVHHWYVPNRLLMDGWEELITGKDDVAEVPRLTIDTVQNSELADHFGMYPEIGNEVSCLPFRAYNMIWNEFYRDQDLMQPRSADDMTLARICWEKDYFTVARPAPQQGSAIELGFSSGEVPVSGIGIRSADGFPVTTGTFKMSDGTTHTADNVDGDRMSWFDSNVSGPTLRQDPNLTTHPRVYADLSQATGGIDLNDLRQALALQRFAEARMRFGSRYVDYLRFLGVNPSDGRLDRPEFLGGGKQQVNFSEVIAMAEGQTTNVGDLYGHGIAGLRSRRFRKMFEEHGWVLSLLSVRPKTVYMQSNHRKFKRKHAMDFWQKELEVLPWQTVYQNEVHGNGDETQVFGYVPRYEEYRYGYSYVSGSFRDGPEVDWHMARDFATPPLLNETFVECTPTDRIYGDNQMPEMLINAYNSVKAMRLVRKQASLSGI